LNKLTEIKMTYTKRDIQLACGNFGMEASDIRNFIIYLDKVKELSSRKTPACPITKPIIDEYFEWYKHNHDGVEPKMVEADTKMAKEIAIYLSKVVRSKNPQASDMDVVMAFKLILDKYPHNDRFYASQVRLSQIGRNITNLISIIKSSNDKSTGEISANNIARIIAQRNSGI